jgi:PAS domain S-box-containing protein
MAQMKTKILLIEDNPLDVRLVKEYLEDSKSFAYQLTSAGSLEEGTEKSVTEEFDVVLLDLSLPDSRGILTFSNLKDRIPPIPIIILTGLNDQELAIHIMQHGAQDYLVKNQISTELLIRTIRYSIERKKSEKALCESENKFRNYIESAPDSIFVVDDTGRYIDVNEAACQMLGYSKNELEKKFIHDLLAEESMEAGLAHFKELTETGKARSELWHKHKDGSIHLFSIAAVKLSENRFLGFAKDITKRIRAEESLAKSEEGLKQAQEISHLGNWNIDLVNQKTTWSGEMYNIFGVKKDEVQPSTELLISHIHPDDRERMMNFMKDSEKDLISSSSTFRIVRKGGKIRNIYTENRFALNKKGNPVGIYGIIQDITERIQAELELRESKALMEAVVENVPLMIFLKEAKDLRFVIFNHAGEELLGYDRSALLGKNNLDLFPPEQAEHFMAKDREVLDGNIGMLDIPEEPIQTAKKGQRLLHTQKICIRGSDGTTKYLLGISEDITDRKQAEEKIKEKNEELNAINISLEEAKEKAEESDKLKSIFLTNLSHELRTPLNGILGFSQLITSTDDKEQIIDFAKIINKSGNQLFTIIEDLFIVSSILSGNVTKKITSVQLSDLLDKARFVINDEILRSDKEGLAFSVFEKIKEEQIEVKADKDMFGEIIRKLIRNAIKFTPCGKIEVGYRVENNEKIIFYVSDTGIGIPIEKQGIIFDFFRQVEESSTKEFGGIGSGLAICKNFSENMNGTITVESKPGKGSIFCLTLPLVTEQPEKQTSSIINNNDELKIDLSNKTVLVVDDIDANRFYLQYILQEMGSKVLLAEDGQIALDLIKKTKSIDLILMDLNMPVMDGYESTKLIKKIRPDIPVIAQSAYAMPEHMGKAKKSGCDAFVQKPINVKELVNTMKECLMKARGKIRSTK